MRKMTLSRKTSPRMLLGHWQSDRARTLEFWGFPRTTNDRVQKLLTAKDFFGHVLWHFTPTRLHVRNMRLKGTAAILPYKVTWSSVHRVAILLGDGTPVLKDIHFDGEDSFYLLAAKANCEFFRRVIPKTSNRKRE